MQPPKAVGELIEGARRQVEDIQGVLKTLSDQCSDSGAAPFDECTPESIPGFEIQRRVHQGGQGIVYEGVQKSTGRRVAIKVIREGHFATRSDQVRFEREVQILGRLSHPGIVTIHQAGKTERHSYFVMDYIPGFPLDAYMAGGDRAIRPSLNLFAKICDAVSAAHLRGVIHRDLKPGNIRVDENGDPHILDFGLAKSPDDFSGVREPESITLTGQFIGSLHWASPEQADGAHTDVDTRSDVYALGLILFQMLTGRLPYSVIGSTREVLERIVKVDPIRPRSIRPEIDDEIETILLKCLAKEPERRYQSAGELARDIDHYLRDEPIEAKRGSAVYVLRKYACKHRTAFGAAAVTALLVAAGSVTSLTFWRIAVGERQAAELARSDEARQRREAEASAREAVQEAEEAEAINEFLQTMLASSDPARTGRSQITVREVVAEAVSKLDAGALREQPLVQSAVRHTIGNVYRSLALHTEAEVQLRTALIIRERELGPDDPGIAAILGDLSGLLRDAGRFAEAVPMARRAVDICGRRGPEDLLYASLLDELGQGLRQSGNLLEPERHYRKAVTILGNSSAGQHPRLAQTLSHLAALFASSGRIDEAESLYREALTMQQTLLGEPHPDVANTLSFLATLLADNGRDDEAEALFHRSLAMRRELFGEAHPDVASCLVGLALTYTHRGDPFTAESLLRDALTMRRALLGENSTVAMTLTILAGVLRAQGDAAQAESLARESLNIGRRVLPENHYQLAGTLRVLVWTLLDQRCFAEAEGFARECLRINEATMPVDHHLRFNAKSNLGAALMGQGRFDEAEHWLLDGCRGQLVHSHAPRARKREAIAWLIEFYESWDAAEPGNGHDAQSAEWRDKLAEWECDSKSAR